MGLVALNTKFKTYSFISIHAKLTKVPYVARLWRKQCCNDTIKQGDKTTTHSLIHQGEHTSTSLKGTSIEDYQINNLCSHLHSDKITKYTNLYGASTCQHAPPSNKQSHIKIQRFMIVSSKQYWSWDDMMRLQFMYYILKNWTLNEFRDHETRKSPEYNLMWAYHL